jgi:hypothetical protein
MNLLSDNNHKLNKLKYKLLMVVCGNQFCDIFKRRINIFSLDLIKLMQ